MLKAKVPHSSATLLLLFTAVFRGTLEVLRAEAPAALATPLQWLLHWRVGNGAQTSETSQYARKLYPARVRKSLQRVDLSLSQKSQVTCRL